MVENSKQQTPKEPLDDTIVKTTSWDSEIRKKTVRKKEDTTSHANGFDKGYFIR